MSWPTVKTWTAVVVTVADMNTEVRDRMTLLKTSMNDDGRETKVTRAIAVNAALTSTDDIALATGAITISLPTSATAPNKTYVIKNVGASTVTVNVSGGVELIDNATTFSLTVQWSSILVGNNGSQWYILAKYL